MNGAEGYMKQIAAIFLVIMLASFSFGCNDDDGDNKAPTAWLSLEPPEAVIYDNSTGFTYPEILLNGSESKDPDGRITYYFFDMGEGNTTQGGSGDNSTTHEYQICGNFEVSLEVEDNKGDKDKATKELTVNYEMNHVGGPLQSGDSEAEPFPVSEYSAYNATVIVNISNDDPDPFTPQPADARVSIVNSAEQEVKSQEETDIQDYRVVILTLNKNELGSSDPGTWRVVVECQDGTITYTCHLELYYKS